MSHNIDLDYLINEQLKTQKPLFKAFQAIF